MLYRCLWGAVLLSVIGPAGVWGVEERAGERRLSVLLDRSHDYAFEWNSIALESLRPAGMDVTSGDASLTTYRNLGQYDVVFIGQIAVDVAFSASEVSLLREYVANGGALILLCNPERPITSVAAAFGVRFVPGQLSAPAETTNALRSLGAPSAMPARSPRFGCTVSGPPNAVTLLEAADGAPVAIEVSHGRGRVLCVQWEAWLTWSTDTAADRACRSANVALFTRAAARSAVPSQPAGAWHVVNPENTVPLPGHPEVVVYYADTVAAEAQPVIALLPQLIDAVVAMNGPNADPCPLRVILLPTNGGGVAGREWVAVSVLASVSVNIAIIGHELTHVLAPPLPGLLCEAWPSYVGRKLCEQMGYPEALSVEDRVRAEMQEADPTGVALDVSDDASGTSSEGRARSKKLIWMIHELERRHGPDFVPRVWELLRAMGPSRGVGMPELLSFLGLVAGEDLTAWYKQLGVRAPTVPVPSASEVAAALRAYRARVLQLRQDHDALAEYTRSPDRFLSDDWRDGWKIEASSYGLCSPIGQYEAWLEDAAHPWAEHPDLARADAGSRRGFLIFHAPAPNQPGRLSAEIDIPKDGRTALWMGLARRNGWRADLRLTANGKAIWQRDLTCDGWLHIPIDLTTYAGQRVRLALETGDTDQWQRGEVWIDYITLAGHDEAGSAPQ